MNKFNSVTSRYIMCILVICFMFVFLVVNSFRYAKKGHITESQKLRNHQTEEEVFNRERPFISRKTENKTVNKKDEGNSTEISNENTENKNIDIPELETISTTETEEKIKELSPADKIEQLLKEEKYESAVFEYQKLAEAAIDHNAKAEYYQKIAVIYGKIKRYGTGLSFAQKAFNTYPTTDRELLLARLYYKTGSFEKANEHITSILKRDFSFDR